MDYTTFFVTNIATVAVFTACLSLLAWHNREVIGMRCFAAGLIVNLFRLVIQLFAGRTPSATAGMAIGECYLISMVLQTLGMRWFLLRKPLRSPLPWLATGLVFVFSAELYLLRSAAAPDMTNAAYILLCGLTAWLLFRRRTGRFGMVSRVAGVILTLQTGVAGYRSILMYLDYGRNVVDPLWVDAVAVEAFLATILVMCEVWFLVIELHRELADQARTDPLTGAINRRALQEMALRETARSHRHVRPLSMIVIDIDNFKRLNDTRGHPAGDCALQAMVSSLRGTVRAHDLVARTGGEEFAILLPDTNELGALVIADRLRQTVAALAVPFADGAIRLTICAGVAQLDTDSGWEAMMRVADAAMYQAKKHGGNRISSRIALPAINDDVRWNVAVDTRRYVQTVERDVGTIRIPDVVLDVGKSFGRQEYVRDLE